MRADLHLHTTASDGALSPRDTVFHIADLGAELVAVTDHDTVDGLDEAAEAAREKGVKFVCGIEISARSTGEIHVLGYRIDYKNPDFVDRLQEIKTMRVNRNLIIGERLAALGVAPDMDFGANGLGRKNIADAMVRAGFVSGVQEAFDRYLGAKGAAYVAAKRVTPLAAVRLIKDFGGLTVLAHPRTYLYDKTLQPLIEGLKPHGLAGLEVYYPKYSDADVSALERTAKKYGLIATGGSDYHGEDEKNFVFEPSSHTLRALGVRR